MTLQEAQNNIGNPFKLIGFSGGAAGSFDKIIRVDDDGTIHGEFLQAHCDDCRLKQEQPEHLRKWQEHECSNFAPKERLTDEGSIPETGRLF